MAKQAANDSIKTQLNGPWPGVIKMEKKPRKPPSPEKPVNFDIIKKTSAPYIPPRTGVVKSKYDELFSGCKEGDCWETSAEDVSKLEKALNTWLKRNNIEGIVKRNAHCPDGIARVWLYKVMQHRKAA